MKKTFIFVLSFLFLVSLVWGAVSENFDALSEGSYGTYTHNGFEINNGLCSSTNARTGNAVRLRNAASFLEYEGGDGNGKDGGVGTISFWYRAWDSSPTAVYDVSANINGGGWSNIGSQISTSSTTYSEWTYDLNNSSDNILIRVTRSDGERLHIDDFSITDYSTPTNDQTSYVTVPAGQVPSGTVQSYLDTSGEAQMVFTVNITDAATSDALPTIITNMRLKPYSSNSADWSDNIQGITINGGTVTTGTQTITDTYIDIPFALNDFVVPTGTTVGVLFSVYLNTSNIADNDTLSFFIDADNHGFTADPTGSGFASDFGSDINSNDFYIRVTASASGFISVPSSVTTNTDFSVTCGAVDVNGNIDVDYSANDIELSLESGTGNLSGTGVGIGDGQTLVNGVYTWADVQYDTAEDFELDALIQNTSYNSTSGTITASVGSPWVINEILADPDASLGDANGDGSVNTSEDEFVELINNSDSSIDISGWTLSDGFGIRHTFANSTVIPANNAVVVFGGGTPTGSFGGASVVVATTGSLGLNNSGDTITLDNGSDAEVVAYTYGSEGGDNQSITRDPDITGSFVKHSLASGSGGALFSPGNNANGTPLPVTLSDFTTAIIMNEFVQVSWTTQSESSINSWNLYRSTEDNSEQVLLNTQAGTNTVQPTVYTFEDHEVDENVNYYYYLEATEYDGTSNMWGPITAFIEGAVIEELPTTSMLQSNYPNPFNPSTTIMCDIKDGEEGKLTIFNSRGQVIESQKLDAGEHIIEWDGTQYGSGVYLYKLETLSYTKTRKMMMIK
jgi:hypothetical protein